MTPTLHSLPRRKPVALLASGFLLFALPAALPFALAAPLALAPQAASAQQTLPEPSADAAVRKVLGEQVEAWNRGDLDAFLKGYSDSEATLFVGKQLVRGYTAIAARYRHTYPTRQTMGELSFAEIEVRPLSKDCASVVGRFSLKRSVEGGGGAEGIFSLIFEKTAQGWKIVLDHTS